jgi:hypothetical protein
MGALATLLLGGALGYFLLFTFSTSLTLFGMIIPKGSWNLLQLAGAKVVFGPMVFCARVCFTIFEWWWHQSVHWMLWSLSLLALPTIAFGIFTVQVSYIYICLFYQKQISVRKTRTTTGWKHECVPEAGACGRASRWTALAISAKAPCNFNLNFTFLNFGYPPLRSSMWDRSVKHEGISYIANNWGTIPSSKFRIRWFSIYIYIYIYWMGCPH